MTGLSIRAIENCLPQTQCTRCTYPCCTDYAEAIANGEANINQCPPGGDVSINKLAKLSGQKALPLNPEMGEFQPKTLAYIIEDKCIGCVLCIKACPVDAIVGANKLMHTVIQSHCTGCELCVPVCPTDCIEMQALQNPVSPISDWPGYTPDDIKLAKARFERRQDRIKQTIESSESTKLNSKSRQQAIMDAISRKSQGLSS